MLNPLYKTKIVAIVIAVAWSTCHNQLTSRQIRQKIEISQTFFVSGALEAFQR
jgi:hypothetical protein